MSDETGRKDDAEKPRWDLVQPKALAAYVRVLTFGARKYAPENWRKVPEPTRRYLAAALRHVMAYLAGERRDAETNESHLAHALCCLAFVLELDEAEGGR